MKTIMSGLAIAVALGVGSSAEAAALGGTKTGIVASGQLEQAHYTGRYHCHWRRGYRRCHGPDVGYYYDDGPYYRSYRSYGYGPGIYLRFGDGYYDYGYRGYGYHRWAQERFKHPLGRR